MFEDDFSKQISQSQERDLRIEKLQSLRYDYTINALDIVKILSWFSNRILV